MIDDDNFLARWSRRKRRPAQGVREQQNRQQDSGTVAHEVSGNSASSHEIKLPFDPESLPPIESIGPNSDVRAFLAAGVPPDLTRAALRRLWSSDPKIRDFVGLSENSWDFNAPGAMAGFGTIDKEQARRVLTRLLGDPDIEAVASPSTNTRGQAGEVEIGLRKSAQESADSTAADEQTSKTGSTADEAKQAANTPAESRHASALPPHRPARRKGSALPR